MIVREILKEEKKRTDELFAIAFEQPMPKESEPDASEHCWAAFTDEGDMMSSIMISDYNMNLDGKACRAGGVGAVESLPQYRRRGGIRACFENALPWMYKNNYAFSYLFPFSSAYYRKFGYENCAQRLEVSVNLGLLKPENTDGHFVLAEKNNGMGKYIKALDRLCERRYNTMVIHDESDYAWTEYFRPAETLEFCYVYFSRDNTAKAYTVFRMQQQNDGRNLVCSKFCFADREGFSGLMNLFKSLASDHSYVKFQLPAEPELLFMLPEWKMGAVSWAPAEAGMIRAVNVISCLEAAKYRGSGKLTLKINDTQIAENNHCFMLEFENGKAVNACPTELPPDAEMDISVFSTLIAGSCDFSVVKNCFSSLRIFNTAAPFENVFYKKPMMINEYF
ncbi:MAG: GNAT family N-acetyltransferase [Candidatus Limivicinus sp.]|jgi:predicted acetyltransferase